MITNDSSLLRILKTFSSRNNIGFTEIAHALEFETDLTGYYLRKLQNKGLIDKTERGVYQITPLGKSVVAHSSQLSGLAIVPRISIMIIASYNDEFIVLERAKQPFIGAIEWPTYPLKTGVNLSDGVSVALKSRLGIDGNPELKGFFRRIDMNGDIVFDDKLFAVHHINLTQDQKTQIVPDSSMGLISFKTAQELGRLSHASRSLIDILEFYKRKTTYAEAKYELKNEDLYTP